MPQGKPLDGRKNPGGRPAIYPWRTMEVGESFLAPERFTKTSQVAYHHAGQSAQDNGLPHWFRARTETVDGQRRVRVYRVR